VTFEWDPDSLMDGARDAARLADLLPAEPKLTFGAASAHAVLVVECTVDEFCENLMAGLPDQVFTEPSANGSDTSGILFGTPDEAG